MLARFSGVRSISLLKNTVRCNPTDPRSQFHPRDPRRKMDPRDPRLKEMAKDASKKDLKFELEMANAAGKVVKDKYGGDPHKLDEEQKKQLEYDINESVHQRRREIMKENMENIDNGHYKKIERPIDEF